MVSRQACKTGCQGQGNSGPRVVPAPGVGPELGAAEGGWRTGEPGISYQRATDADELWNEPWSCESLFGWFAAEEVYGCDRKLRPRLERPDVPLELAVKKSERLWARTDKGTLRLAPSAKPGRNRKPSCHSNTP